MQSWRFCFRNQKQSFLLFDVPEKKWTMKRLQYLLSSTSKLLKQREHLIPYKSGRGLHRSTGMWKKLLSPVLNFSFYFSRKKRTNVHGLCTKASPYWHYITVTNVGSPNNPTRKMLGYYSFYCNSLTNSLASLHFMKMSTMWTVTWQSIFSGWRGKCHVSL